MTSEAGSSTDEATPAPGVVHSAGALPPDAFEAYLASELGVARSEILPGARLVADLGFDSLQMLELVLILDSLGARLDAEELDRACRIGDLYRLYVEHRALVRYGDLVCVGSAGTGLDATRRIAAPLVSPRTRQRPVVQSDYVYLLELLRAERVATLWRHRGRPVNPERFAAMLWDEVLVQHVAVEAASDSPIGLMTAYAADLVRRSAKLEILLDPRVQGKGWPLEAAVLFVNYLFRMWPLRKLYAEVVRPSAERIMSGSGRFFVEEGRLVEHEFVDGSWVDLHILSVFRERCETARPGLLGSLLGSPRSGQGTPRRPNGHRGHT